MHTRSTLTLAFAIATVAIAGVAPQVHEVERLKTGGAGGWDYLVADGGAHRFYVSRGDRVEVFSTDPLRSIGVIPNTPGVHGVALDHKLGKGFSSNGRDNTVTIFDLKTLKTLGTVSVGNRPDAICFEPVTGRVFTFNGGGGDATAIDAATGKVVGSVPLGGRPEFAVADGKGSLFVNIEDKNEVATINANLLTVTKRASIAPGDGPSGIAMDPVSRRVFSVCGNHMMTVLNADTGKVVTTIPIGEGPDAAGFDPRTKTIYSSNGEGTLTVIHEDTPDQYRVVETVKTMRGARTMSVDTRTHRVYTVTAEFGAPVEGQRRPPMTKDSFTILVYGK